MNIYDLTTTKRCPVDNAVISYSVRLVLSSSLMVEDILDFLSDSDESIVQEDFADKMFNQFGGWQEIRGYHSGVLITTFRGLSPKARREQAND